MGKTTGEMKTLATFVDAGWDFEETWAICEGTNYPRLQWQIPAGDWVCPDGVAMEDLDYFAIRWLMADCAANGDCDGADLNRDGVVRLEDMSILAAQWLTGTPMVPESFGPEGMEWVSIVNDPGIEGHEGFSGYMSKYEVTNAQYCQYLNEALATGDIMITGDYVSAASGLNPGVDYPGQSYYTMTGMGLNMGATNGGASRIHYTGGSFTVDSGFENHPVTWITWYGAMAFCNYYGWRLPTEWEWQAAADYDGSYIWGFGATYNDELANTYYDYGLVYPDGTSPVGAFGTYGYGMADISGNVMEWTSDVVLRGGGWYSTTFSVSYRFQSVSNYWLYDTGFRVCR
jgi:hypothetical protein